MSSTYSHQLPTRSLKWLFVLTFASLFWILGSTDSVPFPYTKTPFGISIGMASAIFFVGMLFLVLGKAPRLIYTLPWCVGYFVITGWFSHPWADFHVTTLSNYIALAAGFAIGVMALYWLYPKQKENKPAVLPEMKG